MSSINSPSSQADFNISDLAYLTEPKSSQDWRARNGYQSSSPFKYERLAPGSKISEDFIEIRTPKKGRYSQIDVNPVQRNLDYFRDELHETKFFQQSDLLVDRVTGKVYYENNADAAMADFEKIMGSENSRYSYMEAYGWEVMPKKTWEALVKKYGGTLDCNYVFGMIMHGNGDSGDITSFKDYIQLLTHADTKTKKNRH